MPIFAMETEGQQIAVSVPLFLRKLWKMVNDEEAEDIIGWNSTGDGFVIYDQLRFITKLLPKYFKHNNMASFIRQLNFYDFHKVAGIDKDEIQFTHSCFLKDLPETLVFIRRKCTSLRSKLMSVKDEELSEILTGVKELKSKHSLVDNELKMLKQENAALWSEVNNLRLKHAKQTKIINKIIHFLISYMHSHQNSLSKAKVSVGRRNPQNLKAGPTILELDYDNGTNYIQKKVKPNSYTVTEPEHSGAITYPSSKLESFSNMQPAEHTLDEILDKVGVNISENDKSKHFMRETVTGISKNVLDNAKSNMSINTEPSVSGESNLEVASYQDTRSKAMESPKPSTICNPSFRKKQVPVQNSAKYKILHNPKEHLDVYVNNTQMELDSLQDMLNNLNSTELTSFYNLFDGANFENLKGANNKTYLTNISQEMDGDPEVDGDSNMVENDAHVQNSLVEELATLPVDTNIVNDISIPNNLENGEYTAPYIIHDMPVSNDLENENFTTGNLDEIDKDVILPEEYFTI